MPKRDDSTQMYRIAKLYYIENIPQTEIAEIEGVSRSTVSRLLDKARSSGCVTVNVRLLTDAAAEKTGSELAKRLELNEVIVAPVVANENTPGTEMLMMRDVVSVAAAHMPRLLKDSNMVGIGWGRTMYKTAAELPYSSDNANRLFVPMANNFTNHERYLQTSSIVARFAEQFEANGYYLNISNLGAGESERSEAELDSIRKLVVYWDVLDAAVFSINTPAYLISTNLHRAIWSKGVDALLASESNVLFECMGYVVFSDGSCVRMSPKNDILALDLHRLREIKNSICIAAGIGKADALISAATNGYFKTLVVDHPTAKAMLTMLGRKKRPSLKG